MTPAELAELPKIVAEIRKARETASKLDIGSEEYLFAYHYYKRLLRVHADSLLAAAEECERLRVALRELVEDGECYCSDNVAARGPCGHCKARAALEGKP